MTISTPPEMTGSHSAGQASTFAPTEPGTKIAPMSGPMMKPIPPISAWPMAAIDWKLKKPLYTMMSDENESSIPPSAAIAADRPKA